MKIIEDNIGIICLILFILQTDLVFILNIQPLRMILGFILVTFIPGFLILNLFNLKNKDFTQIFLLSIGLSLSFVIFYVFIINNVLLLFGFEKPLSAGIILLFLNIAILALICFGYNKKKEQNIQIFPQRFSSVEKWALIISFILLTFSISGTFLILYYANNIQLILLLYLIPIYIIIITMLKPKLSPVIYFVNIFSMSISLLLIFMLRFPHICGSDVHYEYYIFKEIIENSRWIFYGSTINSSLSSTLLPAIYQLIIDAEAQQYLFKFLSVFICACTPLAIFIIAKKYMNEIYAFLVSFFFMSQSAFLISAGNPRTNIAIFFVALIIMVFFEENITDWKKIMILITLILSLIISHYATAIIFLIIVLISWILATLLSKILSFKRNVSVILVLIGFSFFYYWYYIITPVTFRQVVIFIDDMLMVFNPLATEGLKSPQLSQLSGQSLITPLLSTVYLIFTWLTFVLIGVGILSIFLKSRNTMAVSNSVRHQPDILLTKINIEYALMVLCCVFLLVISIIMPYISIGYGLQRIYLLCLVLLAPFLIFGGMEISNQFLKFKEVIIKSSFLKERAFSKSFERSQHGILTKIIVLSILIPYFMFTTGVMYQTFGSSSSPTLESGNNFYEYIHDSEKKSAIWLSEFGDISKSVYFFDSYGGMRLLSEGGIDPNRMHILPFQVNHYISGYIYLYHNNVLFDKFIMASKEQSILNYPDLFIQKNKIYNVGDSELYSNE